MEKKNERSGTSHILESKTKRSTLCILQNGYDLRDCMNYRFWEQRCAAHAIRAHDVKFINTTWSHAVGFFFLFRFAERPKTSFLTPLLSLTLSLSFRKYTRFRLHHLLMYKTGSLQQNLSPTDTPPHRGKCMNLWCMWKSPVIQSSWL